LEVLDWGGSGRPVVLLAGGGNTAHVFDEFAPKLTANYHVVGITRRGFGASGYRGDDNTADRLGDDVLAVMDALKLDRPVLVGHSFAGLEMSSVASRYPNRVAGLIYLDAGYSYAFNNGKGSDFFAVMKLNAPQPPPAGAADLTSFKAFQAYSRRVNGFSAPEAELRAQKKVGLFGRVGPQIGAPGGSMLMAVLTSGKKYTQIPAPAFFFFVNPHSLGTWVDRSTDSRVRAEAKSYSEALETLTERQIKSVRDGLPTAQVFTIPFAHHYVYMTNEDLVLSTIRTFITELH
jgi:non-heme chloroperoxidase